MKFALIQGRKNELKIELVETSFDEIKTEIVSNIISYSEPIDSYYEDHIIESTHYRISIDTVICGYTSVFSNTMMTQFTLKEIFLPKAREVFSQVLRLTGVSEIYLSTSDSLLLVMALDNCSAMDVQDYVFQMGNTLCCNSGFQVQKAELKDAGLVEAKHEGFFPSVQEKIAREELFIGRDGDDVVSFGVIENSKLLDDHASLGMFVVKEERGKGYGSMTIARLIDLCLHKGITPVAGCFSKNGYSVNALFNAGMYSKARLLKIKI
jgi:GNAT superfamily N-acetyltransferase